MTLMRIFAGLIIAITFANSFQVVATVGPRNRRETAKRENVLGHVADLDIVNDIVSPDGFPRSWVASVTLK